MALTFACTQQFNLSAWIGDKFPKAIDEFVVGMLSVTAIAATSAVLAISSKFDLSPVVVPAAVKKEQSSQSHELQIVEAIFLAFHCCHAFGLLQFFVRTSQTCIGQLYIFWFCIFPSKVAVNLTFSKHFQINFNLAVETISAIEKFAEFTLA